MKILKTPHPQTINQWDNFKMKKYVQKDRNFILNPPLIKCPKPNIPLGGGGREA